MLTNSEIRKLQAQHPTENDPMQFARAVIAAYEAELRDRLACAFAAGGVHPHDVYIEADAALKHRGEK